MRSASGSLFLAGSLVLSLVACGDDAADGAGSSAGGGSSASGQGGASASSSGGAPASTGTDASSAAGPGSSDTTSAGTGGAGGSSDGGAGGGTGGLSPWPSTTERCDGAVDEDADGLVDEDCAPSLFGGVFVPAGVGLADPAVLDAIEADAGSVLPVVQTYRSTSAAGAANAALDLAAIWARGSTPHLNVEPLGYTPAQLAAAGDDPELAADVAVMAEALAGALAAHPGRSLLLTFAAEMNGDWTDWGCLPPATFIAFYRWAHGVFDAALAARAPAIDARRVRWVFGPNNVSSGGCGSPAAYYPGHAYGDYLGMSAYRSGTQSVAAAVTTPAHALLDQVSLADPLQADRFIVLQTGTRDEDGDDRDQWIRDLFADLAADPVFRGAIYFDSADWAVATSSGGAVTKLVGYDGLVDAIASAAPSDARLAATFEPYFWDVAQSDPSYPEIQSLRAAGLTSGCDVAPPRFCPTLPLTRADAAVLLGRAFDVAPETDSEPRYDDVPEDASSFGLVQALTRTGVLAGCSDVSFCPNDAIARGDLALALVRLAEVAPVPIAEPPFDDLGVEGDDASVQALGAATLVDGCGGSSFCAGDPTTRDAGARWIVRVAGVPEGGRIAP